MHHSAGAFPAEVLFLVPALAAAAAYTAGARSNRAAAWPLYRTGAFLLGLVLALLTVLGPLPALAHTNFTWLALSHVAAGMLAPLLLVLSRPVTLALRVMDKRPARRLVRLLRSSPARFLSHAVTAAVLNVGGMFLMFRTPLLDAMTALAPVHWLVTFHLVAAGYLWTAALIGRDPNPHRAGTRLRAAVLIATAAAHNILAKSLYADPPAGVQAAAAESGAMAMYYAGGAVEIAVMVVFCLQWYRSSAPARSTAGAIPTTPDTQKARSAVGGTGLRTEDPVS
ncbi:cytochrome c oxidase assembly protein [Arthrobacter sp. NPDC055585]